MAAKQLTNQFDFDVVITTTEMHTGGECVRIIESGYPVPQGKTITDKINDLRENHDDYRKFTMLEPRGHFDMYGVLLVTPDHPEADIGAIFLHNEGYGPMCGHVCISLARYAVDRGLMRRAVTSPETQVNIQVPCGLIKAFVSVDESPRKKSGRVRLESVPCFVAASDVEVPLPGHGPVKVDVVYSGAFYILVDVHDLGLAFGTTTVTEFANLADDIKKACNPCVTLTHPEVEPFLYGVLWVDSRNERCDTGPSTHLCIFADKETDRSPCGSGTMARIALMHHKGLLAFGESQVCRNPFTGSEFTGRPLRETTVGPRKAVITEIEGQGFYSGKSTFHLEKGDVIGRGFLVR